MKRHIAILVAVLVAVSAAHADPIESFWLPLGGDFEDPASWSGPVPDETVTAIFDLAPPGPFVSFNAEEIAGRVIVRNGELLFTLWDNDPEQGFVSRSFDVVSPSFATPSIVVAENTGEVASLSISHGFVSAQSLIVGVGPGSSGAIDFSTGLFGLTAGLSCAEQLHVGSGGAGLLTIDSDVVVTAGETVLGVGTGSFGEVIVTSAGSRLDVAGPFTVGKQGQGILSISDLADVTNTDALIGMQPGAQGEVIVTGQGASWTNDGSLDVGFQGEGSLSVTGGAAVFTHGFAAIGSFPEPVFPPVTGGVGDVSISGPASVWLVDGDLFVGLQWFGTLDILGGATVTSQAGIVGLSGLDGIVANVEGPGSVWSTIEDITVFPGAMLRIAGGAVVLASVVDVLLTGAELEADGTIVGDLDSNGTVRIGDAMDTGMLNVDGDFTTTGHLLLDLGGPAPGSFDTVAVSGDVSVANSLTVSLVGGFVPQFGDAFQVLTAASISGAFFSVTLPALDDGLVWHFNQDADSVDLLVTTIGDLDGDGMVGITDFLLLLGAWGPCPAPPAACPADLDGDGMVGITDFLILLAQWSA